MHMEVVYGYLLAMAIVSLLTGQLERFIKAIVAFIAIAGFMVTAGFLVITVLRIIWKVVEFAWQ